MSKLDRMRHYRAVMKKIDKFRADNRYSDVDIKVNEKVFECHRLILSAASEYFERMFNGNFKESSATEITLQEIETNVFEGILQFIYTGNAEIDSTNACDFIHAAEFYKLPILQEICIEFVERNLDAIASDVLKIFSFACEMGIVQLVELLSKHIHNNFRYFSKTAELGALTFDNLMKVFDLIDGTQPAFQDTYVDGIFTWFQHQPNLPADKKELCMDRLVNRINFKNISVEYTENLIKQQLNGLLSGQLVDDVGGACATINAVKFLHAYVSRDLRGNYGISKTSSIFTVHRDTGVYATSDFAWVYSGELEYCPDFIRNIVIDDRIYSLSYLTKLRTNGSQQIFRSSSSTLMYPCLSLRLPPLLLDDFDMCGAGDLIYVYSKNMFSQNSVPPSEDSTFSLEELSRGMYSYKRDIDKWFPLPRPKMRFANACMTCDEKMVYLIGGSKSNKYVQAYDSRMKDWSALPSTAGVYDKAACCTAGNKIYVAGGLHNPFSFEMYDPISGNWQSRNDLRESQMEHQLVHWSPPIERSMVLSFNDTLASGSKFLSYWTDDDSRWYPMPNLFDVVKKKENSKNYSYFRLLNMVYF